MERELELITHFHWINCPDHATSPTNQTKTIKSSLFKVYDSKTLNISIQLSAWSRIKQNIFGTFEKKRFKNSFKSSMKPLGNSNQNDKCEFDLKATDVAPRNCRLSPGLPSCLQNLKSIKPDMIRIHQNSWKPV